MSNSLRFKPVVAFDVDGVLRVGNPGEDTDGYFSREITYHKSEYPTVFHGSPRWEEDGTKTQVDWFSSAGADLLKVLTDSADVDTVWATTWQGFANTYFGSVLDIPALPVAVTADSYEDVHVNSSPQWKALQLSQSFPGRPLLWLDDNILTGILCLEEMRRPYDRALTCSYSVNPFLGVTVEDAEQVLEWVELASTLEGQAVLRKRRQERVTAERLRRARMQRQRERERQVEALVREKAEALFPSETRLSAYLGWLGRLRYGLTAGTVQHQLDKYGVEGDAAAIVEQLRVPRYHFKESVVGEGSNGFYDF